MIDNYFESEDFLESLSRYEKSIRDGDSCYMDSDDFINISDYYVENGDVDKAYQCLTEAIRLHPSVTAVKIAYAGVLICQFQFKQVNDIIKDIDELEAYDVLYLKGQLCIALDHDYDAAEDFFLRWLTYIDEEAEKNEQEEDFDQEIFTNDSMSRDARFRIMMSYTELCEIKQDDFIRKWVREYVDIFKHLGFYKTDYSVVETCRCMGYFDILEEILPIILEINPYMDNGWTTLGVSQHMNSHDEEATLSLEYALAVNPDDHLANITFAHCMLTVDNVESALNHFLHFRKLTGEKSEDFYIGKCYYRLNDKKSAKLYFQTAYLEFMNSQLNSNRVDSCYELAESLFACDDFDSSENLLHKILELNPTHHFALMLYGCIHLNNNCFEEAMDIFGTELERSNFSVSSVIDVASRFLAYDYNQMAILLLNAIDEQSKKSQEYKTFALLAMAYIKEGLLKEALKNLKIVCDNSPEIVNYYFAEFLPETVLPADYYFYLSGCLKKLIKNEI